nr:uncharacterized protein SYNPCC7002_A1628-like [Nerophis lumbriciformis]
MSTVQAFYCDHFVLPLPSGHRFPMAKYRLLREVLLRRQVLRPEQLQVPLPVSDQEILRAHTTDYFERARDGRLGRREQRRIGFPWSPELLERSRRSAGGTLAAARAALAEGTAVNLAGGTHHAFADRGEGFCVFNDTAIAFRAVAAEGLAGRALVVDCDVHQGNGTASIFAGDSAVFTLSLHGRKNYPFAKEQSDLDVELDDGTGDAEYLERLTAALEQAFDAAQPELVFYLAGADPFAGDKLGRLALSKDGLRRRDQHVVGSCRQLGLPVVVTMAGGYAERVEDIVDIHCETVRIAANHGSG